MPAMLGSQMPERHLHSFTLRSVIIERSVASRRIVPNFSAALEKHLGTLVRGNGVMQLQCICLSLLTFR